MVRREEKKRLISSPWRVIRDGMLTPDRHDVGSGLLVLFPINGGVALTLETDSGTPPDSYPGGRVYATPPPTAPISRLRVEVRRRI